jgi:phosphoribosylformylglycinamidine synthase
MYVDLAEGRQALGGSALVQAFRQLGDEAPDVRDPYRIIDYYDAIIQLLESGIVLTYHDISDGGMPTTIAKIMFAGRCGAKAMVDSITYPRSSLQRRT